MSKIDIKFLSKTSDPIGLSQANLSTIIYKAIDRFNLTSDTEIEILFVKEQEIKKLNLKYRGINSPTDVLSFPQKIFENNKLNILGSVVICPKKVQEKDELMEDVVKHGLLHLLGYDHDTNKKEWDKAAKKINCKL